MGTLSDFYRSEKWRRLREIVIAERLDDMGRTMCDYCGKPIVKAYDITLHHTETLTADNVDDGDVSLNPEKLMIVHHGCHNEIHERFGFGTRHVYLIYGAPCSGKTAFVDGVAGRDDIVIDMDNIFEMISVNPKYTKPASLKAVAFAVRDCLLDAVRVRLGRWTCAYIVGGYPMASERERMAQLYGAEPIYIEASIDECMDRAGDRPDEWREYIQRWFERYTA